MAATWKLEFPYRRSVGPVIGEFLAGLRDRKVLGAPTPSGRVLVPPLEYDPDTGDSVGELREVGQAGVVEGYAWVPRPESNAPLDRPFAYALVRLDGADTAMLHALDAGSPDAVQPGMRVRIRWRAETTGHITDVECFEPENS
ncbi:MAG: Zn-ribbon domain-containing OB-fold protein [Acidimicrobiia bacterium]